MIHITTLDPVHPTYASLCRFRFELQLPFGNSLTIKRKQFPLRLAYSISYNKSQELNKLALDITQPSFSHGYLYVALSRIRIASNIKFYVTNDNLIKNVPFIDNVVYSKIIDCFGN
jgi:hypothetical protein